MFGVGGPRGRVDAISLTRAFMRAFEACVLSVSVARVLGETSPSSLVLHTTADARLSAKLRGLKLSIRWSSKGIVDDGVSTGESNARLFL